MASAMMATPPLATATHGTLGATSTGSITITVSVPGRLPISHGQSTSAVNCDRAT